VAFQAARVWSAARCSDTTGLGKLGFESRPIERAPTSVKYAIDSTDLAHYGAFAGLAHGAYKNRHSTAPTFRRPPSQPHSIQGKFIQVPGLNNIETNVLVLTAL